MISRKTRRHSGRVSPDLTVPKKELVKNDLFVDDHYDEWANFRDGQREFYKDNSKIKKIKRNFRNGNNIIEKITKNNKKLKRLAQVRKARINRNKLSSSK